jgi:purine-binding chemotaxis protein CheW
MKSRVIDWENIHRRLETRERVISGNFEYGPEEAQRILETRARAAAKAPEKPDDTEYLDILSFSLAGETYGVETCYVTKVCRLINFTALPCAPMFVSGVMNLRGRILAIIDLRNFFELSTPGLTEFNRVIVLKGDDNELGLIADSIEGICSVPASSLQEGLPTLTGIRERFLKGVTGGMLALLDGGRLLTDASLKVNETVTLNQ